MRASIITPVSPLPALWPVVMPMPVSMIRGPATLIVIVVVVVVAVVVAGVISSWPVMLALGDRLFYLHLVLLELFLEMFVDDGRLPPRLVGIEDETYCTAAGSTTAAFHRAAARIRACGRGRCRRTRGYRLHILLFCLALLAPRLEPR